LHAGDQLEFEEKAPFLKATKALAPDAWEKFRQTWSNPCAGQNGRKVLDDLRGRVELPAK
jgi:hypothetical protein